MYQADDPIEGFRAAIHENLVNIANGQGYKEFNPEQDCSTSSRMQDHEVRSC